MSLYLYKRERTPASASCWQFLISWYPLSYHNVLIKPIAWFNIKINFINVTTHSCMGLQFDFYVFIPILWAR